MFKARRKRRRCQTSEPAGVTMGDVAPSVRDTIRRSRLSSVRGSLVVARQSRVQLCKGAHIVPRRPHTERRAKPARTAIATSPSDSLPSILPPSPPPSTVPPSQPSLFRRNRVPKLACSCIARRGKLLETMRRSLERCDRSPR